MKKIIIQLLLFSLPILVGYMITTLKSQTSSSWEFFVIVSYIIALFLIITLILILFFIHLRQKLTISDDTIYGECEHSQQKDCCVKTYIKSLKQCDKVRDLILSDEILENYKLMSCTTINEKEKTFVSKKNNGAIWIFSHDLSSEILGDESQKIVIENIKKGLKYVEFVIYNEETKDDVDKNEEIFYTKIPERFRDNIKFKHIVESEKIINILPYLLGSIIFVDGQQVQSYFSLRGGDGKINDPIYFTMPECMNKKYYQYFKIINKQEDQRCQKQF